MSPTPVIYDMLRRYELDTLYGIEILLDHCHIVSDIRKGLENSPSLLAFHMFADEYVVTRAVQRLTLNYINSSL